jgi:hypothetical protein
MESDRHLDVVNAGICVKLSRLAKPPRANTQRMQALCIHSLLIQFDYTLTLIIIHRKRRIIYVLHFGV